jgi:Fe-S-cluster containining protein
MRALELRVARLEGAVTGLAPCYVVWLPPRRSPLKSGHWADQIPLDRCRNTQRDNSCAIYERRPQTCRTFYCSWRQLKWIRETMRPDISGVLVRMHREISRQTGEERMGVIFMLLNRKALKAEGLAESVAAAFASEVPVYLQVPGPPPSYTSSQARMNDALLHAVMTKDKPAVLEVLRQAWAQGEKGERRRIVLKPLRAEFSSAETLETRSVMPTASPY